MARKNLHARANAAEREPLATDELPRAEEPRNGLPPRGIFHRWQYAPSPPRTLVQEWMQQGQADRWHPWNSPLIPLVLYDRGYRSIARMQAFLRTAERPEHAPDRLADLSNAVDRLVEARERNEKIAVFTDYDADGVCSAAVLTLGLRALGFDPHVVIPHRHRDGYGLNRHAIDHLHAQGVSLLLTADCGIGNAHEIEHANRLGMDVIVSDHHQLGNVTLPPAHAVINPHRPDCTYPFKGLCGAGVAYKVLSALADALNDDEGQAKIADLIDIVSLATVSDMVPLQDENRRFVKEGIRRMNGSGTRPGIQALKEQVGLSRIAPSHIAFQIGPHLNAAGRIDNAEIAYRLLVSDSLDNARELARVCHGFNDERRRIQREISQQANELARQQVQDGHHAIVLGDPHWPRGIVGLISGQLTHRFGRPSLVYLVGDHTCHGSGRSIPAFNLHNAIRQLSHHLVKCGGHHMAVGFTVTRENLPVFEEEFRSLTKQQLRPQHLDPPIRITAPLSLADVHRLLGNTLDELGPFGVEFNEPLFVSRAIVREARPTPHGDCQITLASPPGERMALVRGIGFQMEDRHPGIAQRHKDAEVWVAYSIETGGDPNARPSLHIHDIAPISEASNLAGSD